MPRTGVCVANADSETVEAARMALDKGLAALTLPGTVMRRLYARWLNRRGSRAGPNSAMPPTPATALREAVRSVRGGESGVLMKGMLNSSDFLRGVLNKEEGLRTGRRLSHIAAGGTAWSHQQASSTGPTAGSNINPRPRREEGHPRQRAAGSALVGRTNAPEGRLPGPPPTSASIRIIPATIDAAGLVEAWERGEFPAQCIVEGPIAMDVALNRESALHKGIESRVSGDADIFLMPIMEVGNVAIKGLLHFLKGSQVAGLILGAAAPVVMTSRSEPPSAKLYATALGCLAARNA